MRHSSRLDCNSYYITYFCSCDTILGCVILLKLVVLSTCMVYKVLKKFIAVMKNMYMVLHANLFIKIYKWIVLRAVIFIFRHVRCSSTLIQTGVQIFRKEEYLGLVFLRHEIKLDRIDNFIFYFCLKKPCTVPFIYIVYR